MAKQKRKQAPAKPITSHQLFPAVVALWFGALFGLGSLAVRPSLLESLVINSRIDLLVPAAAPPLGITARILVALIMAAIGSSLGIAIARRLTRPKPEHRERKRSAGSISEETSKQRHGGHYADAPARQPISINDELGGDDAGLASGILAPRRRSLAIEHEEVDFVPHDMAPLPGGPPQVLDIGEVRITNEAAEAPLELGAYPAPASPPEPAQLQQFTPPPTSPVQLDWNSAAPVQPTPGFAPQAPRQVFQPLPEDEAPPVAPQAYTQEPDFGAEEAMAAAADGRQVFGLTPPAPPSDATRQIFGQPVDGDHVSQEFLREAGYKTTVFETEEPSPLFAPRRSSVTSAEPREDYTVPPAPEIQAFAVPDAYVPPSQLVASSEMPQAPEAAPVMAEPVAPPAAAALPTQPSPAGLGMTDLATRLAESMARRRAARIGEPFVPPAPETLAPASAPLAQIPAAPLVPEAYAPPAPQPEPIAAAFAAPEAAPEAAMFAPPPSVAAPQAMRPLDLNGFEEDDAPIESFLPPRTIMAPSVPVELPQAFTSPVPVPVVPADEAEISNEGVAEASYASLLAVAPPAAPAVPTGFVRIDEPEAEQAAIEPVVIFPGQMVRPAAVSEGEANSFRRFDAPASAEHGQPIAANQAVTGVDPEESQRALRAALANLQRMSGAA